MDGFGLSLTAQTSSAYGKLSGIYRQSGQEFRLKMVGALLLFMVSFGPPTINAQPGWALSPLHPAATNDRKILNRVSAHAKQKRLKNVHLFEGQSFRLVKDRVSLGVFVTGRAIAPENKTSFVCFVTIIEPNQIPNLLMTLEGGSDRVPRCAGPKTVGIVDNASSATDMRIGVIYDSSSLARNEDGSLANTDGGKTFINFPIPMVFGWNAVSHRVFLDEKSTDKAGMAETLPALLKALR